jgi:hypothetical protein
MKIVMSDYQNTLFSYMIALRDSFVGFKTERARLFLNGGSMLNGTADVVRLLAIEYGNAQRTKCRLYKRVETCDWEAGDFFEKMVIERRQGRYFILDRTRRTDWGQVLQSNTVHRAAYISCN